MENSNSTRVQLVDDFSPRFRSTFCNFLSNLRQYRARRLELAYDDLNSMTTAKVTTRGFHLRFERHRHNGD